MSPPLVVVDLQTVMFDGGACPVIANAERLLDHVGQLLDEARRGGRPIAFIRHDGGEGDPLHPDAPGWPIWPGLERRESEPVFSKSVGDAFSNPELFLWLGAQGRDADGRASALIVGAQSDKCVAATVNGGLARDVRVTVVSDAHSTWGNDQETADAIIARCNADFQQAGARLVTTADLLKSG